MFNIFKKKITEKTSVSANGMMFLIDPFNSHFWGMLFSSGSWEPETFDFYKKYTRPDKEIIDIGGWIGPTMLIAYSLNPKKIHMVEADPANFQILKSNCLRNNMQDKVELLHACLTNKTGDIIEFGSTPDRCTSTKHINTPGGIKVLSLDIMEYLKSKDLENVCIIKIDTEGAEAMFAKGLEYISKFPGIAVNLSMHPPFYTDKIQAADTLIPVFQKFQTFDAFGNPISIDDIRKLILADNPNTVWPGKTGEFFSLNLISK